MITNTLIDLLLASSIKGVLLFILSMCFLNTLSIFITMVRMSKDDPKMDVIRSRQLQYMIGFSLAAIAWRMYYHL